jgi:hypothetical protein
LKLTKSNVQDDPNKSDNEDKHTGLIPFFLQEVPAFSYLPSTSRGRCLFLPVVTTVTLSLWQMSLQKKSIYPAFLGSSIVTWKKKAATAGQCPIARVLKSVARTSRATNQRSKSSILRFFLSMQVMTKCGSYRYLQQVISWSLQPSTGLRTPSVWIMLLGKKVVLHR